MSSFGNMRKNSMTKMMINATSIVSIIIIFVAVSFERDSFGPR